MTLDSQISSKIMMAKLMKDKKVRTTRKLRKVPKTSWTQASSSPMATKWLLSRTRCSSRVKSQTQT